MFLSVKGIAINSVLGLSYLDADYFRPKKGEVSDLYFVASL